MLIKVLEIKQTVFIVEISENMQGSGRTLIT